MKEKSYTRKIKEAFADTFGRSLFVVKLGENFEAFLGKFIIILEKIIKSM